MPRFSERVGAVPPMPIQFAAMNQTLKTSIWSFILKVIESNMLEAIQLIGIQALKTPKHVIPDHSFYDGRSWLWNKYEPLQWHQVYDLLEFVVKNCAALTDGRIADHNDKLSVAANEILAEEVSGYRFIQGALAPVTNKDEISAIEEATSQASSAGLKGVYTHLEAALHLLAKKPDADYRNSIKESISAVEATVKKISGEHGGGLDAALRELAKHVEIHKGLQTGFLSLYGYTSGKGGIRHAILEETNIGFDEAKFMLVACSAFVNFLIVKAGAGGLLLGQK